MFRPESQRKRAPCGYLVFLRFSRECLAEPSKCHLFIQPSLIVIIKSHMVFVTKLSCVFNPTLVPLKGQETGKSVIADLNRINGKRWTDLTEDQRKVFSLKTFHALAGVANPLAALDSDEEEDDEQEGDMLVPVPKIHKLTVEEDALYRPIYEALVDLKKVEQELGKPDSGSSSSALQRKLNKVIERIAMDVSLSVFTFLI